MTLFVDHGAIKSLLLLVAQAWPAAGFVDSTLAAKGF